MGDGGTRDERSRGTAPTGLLQVVGALALAGALIAAVPLQASSGDRPRPTASTSRTAAKPRPAPVVRSAVDVLATLPVRGREPRAGFRDDRFGDGWVDVDGNGCRTRDDVLRRDLDDAVVKGGCVVRRGVLHDPYTGRTLRFRRGPHSGAVQIDHVVALADAWRTGAERMDRAQRERLANDPLELLAVAAPVVGDKGAADAARWLPPRRSLRCAYVARQIAVKAEYRLWVTRAEHDAMVRVLARCPAEPLPLATAAR